MIKFIVRRLFFETVPSLIVIVTLSFFLIRLAPGGPFNSEKNISPDVLANLEAHYGMDKPLFGQYISYLSHLVRGDLGPSFKYSNRSVNELIASSFPISLELGILALLFALITGITLGIVASLRPNSLLDHFSMSIGMIGICVPMFVMGPLLVFLFSLRFTVFNVAGWNTSLDRVLPALTLGLTYAAYIARLTRGSMIEVLSQEFIKTARAKGLSETMVLIRHALRGAMIPVVSFLGPAAAGIITGSFVVETIFSIPGLGRFFVTAAFNRDYTMILGTVLFYAVIILTFNTVVDIVQAMLNPKLREQLL